MYKKKINLAAISEIDVCDFSSPSLMDMANFDGDEFVVENGVYKTKPRVILSMASGAKMHIYCDTFEEAIKEADRVEKLVTGGQNAFLTVA